MLRHYLEVTRAALSSGAIVVPNSPCLLSPCLLIYFL